MRNVIVCTAMALFATQLALADGDCVRVSADHDCGGPPTQIGTITCGVPGGGGGFSQVCGSVPAIIILGDSVYQCASASIGHDECCVGCDTVRRSEIHYACNTNIQDCDHPWFHVAFVVDVAFCASDEEEGPACPHL